MASKPPLMIDESLTVLSSTLDARMLPSVESSHPGVKIGRLASAAQASQDFSGSISNSISP